MSNEPVLEPNFEGEEMKIPESYKPTEPAAPAAKTSIINTPIVILLFLILAGILGGLYYWYMMVMSTPLIEPMIPERPTIEENNEPESTTAEARTQALDVVSTSDEIDAIEADIESTNMDGLDAEMNAIDTELNAAMNAE